MPEVITDVKTVGTSVASAPETISPAPARTWIIGGILVALASAIGAVLAIKKASKQ